MQIGLDQIWNWLELVNLVSKEDNWRDNKEKLKNKL